MSTSKSIGSMTQMRVHIDAPLKIDADMDLQNLCILVGTNGSGKSLVLKLNWVINIMTNAIIKYRTGSLTQNFKDMIQKVFDYSFDNQNFNGIIGADYECGSVVSVELDKGKIKDILHAIPADINIAPVPVFMSTDMRTFDNIMRLCQMRKMFPDDAIFTHYKVYDVMYVEKLTKVLSGGFNVTPDIEKTFAQFDLTSKNFESFHYDEQKMFFYAKIKDNPDPVDLRTFSKGEQSLLNMTLGIHIYR